ncbi:hypothetical protein MIR68_006380 [Amoeboaphelidium protococcarum]|nr:hypothetical protein MIR68_006380 [Amoeboaphelidium protococcarum]
MTVVLGFVDTERPDIKDFTVSKLGGLPIAPKDQNNVVKLDPCKCGRCGKLMNLLLQLYAPDDEVDNYAFHRVIYVFVCRDSTCMIEGRNEAIRVIRAQWAEDVICDSFEDMSDLVSDSPYQESYILSEEESSINIDNADDIARALAAQKLNTPVNTDDINNDDTMEECEDSETGVDRMFLKFQKRIRNDLDQVLRYARSVDCLNPEPLYVSEQNIPQQKSIPQCLNCKSERTFEFQLMPQILNYLGLDHRDTKSLDFGSIMIYTCSQSCVLSGRYTEEIAWHQPFSSNGMQDQICQEMQQ